MLSFGFDFLNLHSIYLRVYEFNERAKKLYEKVGFKEVGRLREAGYREGKYFDILFMDILKKEYQTLVKSDQNNWPRIK